MLRLTQHQPWFPNLYFQQVDDQRVREHQAESTKSKLASWLLRNRGAIPTLLLKLVTESGVLEPSGRIWSLLCAA